MSDDPNPSAESASSRPDVKVLFNEVKATEHLKPREQR